MSKLMLAVWPNARPMQYWGYHDDCNSFWLTFRQVGDDNTMECCTQAAEIAGDLGLWVWAAAPYAGSTLGSATIELKAHDIHSAGSSHLRRLASVIDKMNKKKGNVPESFGLREQIILSLHNMGVREAIIVSTPYKVVSVEKALRVGDTGIAIDKMQAMRLRERGAA